MKDNLIQVFYQVLVAFVQTAPTGGTKDFEGLRVLINEPKESVAKKLFETRADYLWIGSFDFSGPSGPVTMRFILEPKRGSPRVVKEDGTWEEFEMGVAIGANFHSRMGEKEAFASAALLREAATCAQGIDDLLKNTKIYRHTPKAKVTRRTKSRDRLGAAIRQVRGLLQVGEERAFEAKKPVVPGMALRVAFRQKFSKVEYLAKGSTCGTKILISRVA